MDINKDWKYLIFPGYKNSVNSIFWVKLVELFGIKLKESNLQSKRNGQTIIERRKQVMK